MYANQEYLTVFKDYDEFNYNVDQLHSDCMDLFNYFMHMILDGMVKGTRKSYETIRDRFFMDE